MEVCLNPKVHVSKVEVALIRELAGGRADGSEKTVLGL